MPKADAGHAVGLFLIAWGIFTTYMFVASLRTTAAIALVFGLLAVTFFLLGIGNAGAHTNIVKAGGWFGLATAAAAAWYASFAAVMNSTFGRTGAAGEAAQAEVARRCSDRPTAPGRAPHRRPRTR